MLLRRLALLALFGVPTALGLLPAMAAGEPDPVENAVTSAEVWALARQNADSSFGPLPGLRGRDSALAILALAERPAAASALTSTAAFLAGASLEGTQGQALRAESAAVLGTDPAGFLASLEPLLFGAGYGPFARFQPTHLDSALAIQAFVAKETQYQTRIVQLVDYLQAGQNADGGWGFAPGLGSTVVVTGEVLNALASLEQLSVEAAVLDRAALFLTARQTPDGGFGGELATAVATRALVRLGKPIAGLPHGNPVAYLLGRQAANGSWGNGHFYTTAQVVRALRVQKANLTIAEFVLVPDNTTPGSLVEARVKVRNTGVQGTAPSQLALRRDTPTGTLLTEVEIPAAAPGASVDLVALIPTAGLSGDFDIVAVVDDREEIDESSENDNHDVARLKLRSGADLVLFPADLSLSPVQPLPGQPFQLRIEARNLGETAVPSFGYRVLRLIAGVPGPEVATGVAGPIAPGGALLLPVSLTFAEGEHTLEAQLDAVNAVAEENEGNNSAPISFFVTDPNRADFSMALADLTTLPAQPNVGDTVSIRAVARNLGQRTATATVAIFESPGANGGEIHRETIELAAGAQITIETSYTVGATGYSIAAVVDPEGVVPELNEANNSAERFFRDLPDLAVGYDNFELRPAEPLAGDLVTVDLTVRNRGTAAALGVELALYDGDPAAGGVLIGSHTFADLPVAGNARASWSWPAAPGRHQLFAVADPQSGLVELSEANNRSSRVVTVPRATGPDLAITATDRSLLTASQLDLRLQGTVLVSLQNLGDVDVAAPFEVRLFVDSNGNRLFDGEDTLLASELVSVPVPASQSATLSLPVDAVTPFHHALIWVELDASDVIAERFENNNQKALYGDCQLPTPAASLEPQLEWSLRGLNVQTVPLVAQLTDDNGDGAIDSRDIADIVTQASDATGDAIFARNGIDGTEIWTFRSTLANPLADHLAQAALADLDGDGLVEILGHQRNGRFVLLEHDGRLKWVSDVVPEVGYRVIGAPAIGDLTGDGVPEIAFGRNVVDRNGRLLAIGTGDRGNNVNYYGPLGVVMVPFVSGYPHSVIADIDLDGRNELIAADTVYRMNGGALEVVWNARVPDRLMEDGWSAVGNLDGDPYGEIAYVSSGQIQVYNHDGSVMAGRRQITPFLPLSMPTYWGGAPTIADLDGNGTSEILVAGATQLVAYTGNLGVLWRKEVGEDFGGFTGVTAFDLDGDGDREVLFNNTTTFFLIDGRNGQTIYSRENFSYTAMEHPAVADIDGDGRAEILLPSNRDAEGRTATQGLNVLGHPSWKGARPIWNQYAYHATNVALDGTVPAPQMPPWQVYQGFRTNLETASTPLYQANLTIGLPRVGGPAVGGVPVTLRIGNGGLAAVPAGLRVELFEGGPNGNVVGSAVTPESLMPGSFLDLQVLWQGAAQGVVTAFAKVDTSGRVAECDETDNEVSFALEANLQPDLAIAAGGVTATSPSRLGSLVNVRVRVESLGIAGSPATELHLFAGDPLVSPPVLTVPFAALAAGAERSVDLLWDTAGLTSGTYSVHVVVDAFDVVGEADETNNRGLAEVVLTEPTLPDLAVQSFTVSPPSVTAGERVRLRVQAINRGRDLEGGFVAAFRINSAEVGRVESPLSLLANESRTLEFELDTRIYSGQLALEVRLDPDSEIPETDETNNKATTGPLTVTSSPLRASITTDKLAYGPNAPVAIAVSVINSATAVTGQLQLQIVDTYGALVTTLSDAPVFLPAGTTALSYNWNTGTTLTGPYSVLLSLRVEDAVRATATRLFSIGGQVEASARLYADRDVYAPLEAAVLTGAVGNLSPNQQLNNLTARVAVRGPAPGATEVFSQSLSIFQLLPGSLRPISAVWEIGNRPGGTYVASLELRDATGLLIKYAETSLQVEDSASSGSGLAGQLTVTPAVVGAGAPFLADYQVQNGGNADMPSLAMRIDLRSLVTGELVSSHTKTEPLAKGESVQGSFGLPSLGLGEESYLVVLVGVLPNTERRLDAKSILITRGISIGDVTVLERDAGQRDAIFEVSLSSPAAQEVRVNFATADGSATAGVDYQATSGELIFAPGETIKTLAVPVFGDVVAEPVENFLVSLSSPVGIEAGDLQGLGTVIDEEGCSGPNLLRNGDAESDLSDWTEVGVTGNRRWVQRFADPVALHGAASFGYSGPNPQVELVQEVDLSAYGTRIDSVGQSFAFSGYVRALSAASVDRARVTLEFLAADGALLAAFDSGELIPGNAWQNVRETRVAPVGSRRIQLRLAARDFNFDSRAEVYFDHFELSSLGVPVLTVSPARFAEGDAGITPVVLDMRLSCPLPSPVVLGYQTSAIADDPQAAVGGALADVDYLPASGTLDLAAGTSVASLDLQLLGDILDERDERFGLGLIGDPALVVLTQAVEVTIEDDDGTVVLEVADVVGHENLGTVELTARLSAMSGRTVVLSWSLVSGSAVAARDFVAASGTLTFAPGELEKTFSLTLVDNDLSEADESFQVRFSASNAVLGQEQAIVTVLDDDVAEISVFDAVRIDEGDFGSRNVTFSISLSRPSEVPILVTYTTSDAPAEGNNAATAGLDYQATEGSVTFSPGTTSQTVTVPVLGDQVREPSEVFLLRLLGTSFGSLVDPEATATIFDDDGIVISISDRVVSDQPGNLSLVVGSTVRVSSSFGSHPASRAVDGRGDTSWLTACPDTAPWIEVEVPTGANINQVRVVGNKEFSGFRLLAGIFRAYDAAGVQLYDSGVVQLPLPEQELRHDLPPLTGVKRVRLTGTARQSSGCYNGLAEFQLLGALPVVGDALVSLSKVATFPVTVDYQTFDGTAMAPADYLAASGQLVFAPGTTQMSVPLQVIGDSFAEPTEKFYVRLANPVEAQIQDGEAEITIIDTEVWYLRGDGSITAAPAGCVRLTADAENRSGAAWRTQKIDLGENFDKTFKVYLGARDEGADGLVFLLQNYGPYALGGWGPGMGATAGNFWPGTAPSFGVEVDTLLNHHGYDLEADHIGFQINGRYWEPLGEREPALPSEANIEDGREHLLRVVWNARTKEIDTFFDGFQRNLLKYDPVASVFGGTRQVYYGLTGGNGYRNEHYFCEQELCAAGSAPKLSVGNGYLLEGDGVGTQIMTLPLTLSCPSTDTLHFDFATVDQTATAGADYQAVSGRVTFVPGQTSAFIEVPIFAEDLNETDETFRVELSHLQGGEAEGAALWNEVGVGTIQTDDIVWHLSVGVAENIDSLPAGCVRLTSDVYSAAGSAWRTEKIDLRRHFDMSFDVYVGKRDAEGADGLMFVLQNQGSTALGGAGSGLGWWVITPSVGVELDTWNNGDGDLPADHLAINFGIGGKATAAGLIQASAVSTNVEDDRLHRMRMVWNAESKSLDVHFDGSERIYHSKDLTATVFGGNSSVYWGFTAGTGSATNTHYFCPVRDCFGSHSRPSLSIGDARLLEGNSGQGQMLFPLTLHCPSLQPVSVRVRTINASALSGSDYLAIDQTVTFQPGETSKTVSIAIVGDTEIEPTESFVVELSEPVQAELFNPRGVGTIESNDLLIRLVPGEVLEGSGGNIAQQVELEVSDASPTSVTLQYATVSGTAVSGQDFLAASGSVTIPAGAKRATLSLTIVGDGQNEASETFYVNFTAPAGSLIASQQVPLVIEDEDSCPGANMLLNPGAELPLSTGWTQVSGAWTSATGTVLEGARVFSPGSEASAEIFQDVDLSSLAVRIDLGTQRFYFEGFGRSLSESPADTTRVVIEFRDLVGQILQTYDSTEVSSTNSWRRLADLRFAPAGSRIARIRLISTRYTGTANNGTFDRLSFRALDFPTLSVVDSSAYEGESGFNYLEFVVQQSCVSTLPTYVDYLTTDVTANAGSDYEARSGTLTLQPATTSSSIRVPVIGDSISELDETLTLSLVNSRNAGIGRPTAVGTILQDEVLLVPGSISVIEGDSGTTAATFTLTLTAASPLTIEVDYATGGGTATSGGNATEGTDYVVTSGKLVFSPGERTKTVSVDVLGDLESEPDESFQLRLSNPINVTLADTRGYATIRDDDVEIRIEDASVVEGNAGTVVAVFPVTLSKVSANSVGVDWATRNGTAASGQDYQSASGRLTIAPGNLMAEVRVTVNGDTLAENGEFFTIVLSAPANARLFDDEGTGVIVDDDSCAGPNLLVNPGAELVESGELIGWTEVTGTTWTRRPGGSSRAAFEGGHMFAAGQVATAELRQEVDVTAFSSFIDAGAQRFAFLGYVSTLTTDNDPARIIVDYLAANRTILASFDSGEIVDATGWQQIADQRLAPIGTRKVAIRLVSSRVGASSGDAYGFFDGLALRPIGTPVLLIGPQALQVDEGDSANVFADYPVLLSCGGDNPIQVDYTTQDGTATLANRDYVAVQGTLRFEPGQASQIIPVEIVGDLRSEYLEDFGLSFSNPQGLVILEKVAKIEIRDADPGSLPIPGAFAVYTLDHQFDTGAMTNVQHDAPNHDQLRLTTNGSTFPYVWVALSNRGTIVKIHANSGRILGEYATRSDRLGNPSRTTVALDGSVWVGNRNGSTVTHFGLPELNQCVDRNNNGMIETSTGYGNILLWPNANGQDTNGGVSTAVDECILHHVKVASSEIRHISVTRDNDVWVSGTGGIHFDLIDGETGQILRTERSFACGGYGGLIDGSGVIWSITAGGSVLRWDPNVIPATAASKRCLGNMAPYGIGIDSLGWVWVSSLYGDQVRKVSPDGNTIIGTFSHGDQNAQGLAVDRSDDVWVSTSNLGSGIPRVGHLKNNGTFVGNVTGVCQGSTGIAVDFNGKVWVVCDNDGKAARIDPKAGPIGADGATPIGKVDLIVDMPGSRPYNYSDMTGYVALRSTAPQGSFTVIQDSGIAGSEWGQVSWNTEPEAYVPPGGSIQVEVRTSENLAGFGGKAWLPIQNGVRFEIFGRYLQVRATLRPAPDGTSPVLSDLRIGVVDDAEVSIGDITVVEGAAGEGRKAVFPITLARPTVLETRFDFVTSNGTALAGSDYQATTGTVVVPAGGTTATLEVPLVGDDVLEELETFIVTLSNPRNAIFLDASAVATIEDDDLPLLPELRVRKRDTLAVDADQDGVASPGDTLRYTITIENVGFGPATEVVFRDLVPAPTSLVVGSITTTAGQVLVTGPVEVALGLLPAGGTATITFDVQVAYPLPLGITQVVNQGSLLCAELPALLTDDPDVDGAQDPTVTLLTARPRLIASKIDTLAVDADGDGVPSPGDTLAYSVVVRNVGNTAATGVQFLDLVPAHTTLVAGSATSSLGTLTSTTTEVEVAISELGVYQESNPVEATIAFQVRVDNPITTGIRSIVNQGAVSAAGLAEILTDDPEVGGTADPTTTSIVARPALRVEKTATLFTDVDNDGVASPGDVLLYRVEIGSIGNTGVTEVQLSDEIPAETTLVAGSLQISQGTVILEGPIEVELGALEPITTAVVTFRVTIDESFPADKESVVNQAIVTTLELPAILSDNPATPVAADPTVTLVQITPEVAISDVVITEPDTGTVAARFEITLSRPSNRPVTVTWTTNPVTASAGADFVSTGGSLTIASGLTAGMVEVEILADLLDELDETFLVELSAATGGQLADAQGLGTILDNDPTPILTVADASVVEGDAGTTTLVFNIGLSSPSSFPVTVDYQTVAASATNVDDYEPISGRLSFAPGALSTTLSVLVVGDDFDETNENFQLELTNPDQALPGDLSALGTIVDDDEAQLVVTKVDSLAFDRRGDGEVNPGDRLRYQITLRSTGTGTVGAINLTDLLPAGLTLVEGSLSTSLGTITATQPITVVVGDLLPGTTAEVQFEAAIADPYSTATVVNQATVTSRELPSLLSDDPDTAAPLDPTTTPVLPLIEISIGDVTVTEGDAASVSASFPIQLSRPGIRPITVAWTSSELADGIVNTATSSLDFRGAAGTLTIPAGSMSASIEIEVLPDLLDELDESFAVRLGEASSGAVADGTGVGKILDNDAPVSLAVADASVLEGDSGSADLVFTVTLGSSSGRPIVLSFATSDQNAGAADYQPTSGELILEPGELTATIAVPILGDRLDETDETFLLVVTAEGATVVDGQAVGTIVDDDEPTISIDDVTVEEGDSGTLDAIFNVSLSIPSDQVVVVDYETAADTARETEDFLASTGSLRFEVGETVKTITVKIVGDLAFETYEEHFFVDLDGATAAVEDGQGRGTILDNEPCSGPNLLLNAGAEATPVGGNLPSWIEVLGTNWQQRRSDPSAAEGQASFYPGVTTDVFAELAQPVTVASYQVPIDGAAGQDFAFSALVRTREEVPSDVARIVVEYRDASGTLVLDSFDTGEIASPLEWQRVSDVRKAPAGTRLIQVRLLARRLSGSETNTYFDDLSLTSLRTPVLTIGDVTVYEGSSGTRNAVFPVRLSCPIPTPLSMTVATSDGTAKQPGDYSSVAGSLTLPAGSTSATVEVPVVGDGTAEPTERFTVDLAGIVDPAVVVFDSQGVGTIVDDDFCERSPGYWKTHRANWPVSELVLGGLLYNDTQLMSFLNYGGPNAATKLARAMVASEMNIRSGSDPSVLPILEQAHVLLTPYPPGSNPPAAIKTQMDTVKNQLEAFYNSTSCP